MTSLIVVLAFSALYCQSPVARAAAAGVGGAVIDVFTQKKPYNGYGINMSSDAFGPDETVTVYANVTYNMFPVQAKTVTFVISGPPNPIYNFTISQTATTNLTGIATTDFRFPWPTQNPETAEFGTWSVKANTDISGETISDTVDFQVGWLVRITGLSIWSEFFQLRNAVMKGTNLIAQISMESICMTNKSVTLSISAEDSLKQPVGAAIFEDFRAQPGQSLADFSLQIKDWAKAGNATLSASVRAYQSSMSIAFKIAIFGDLNDDGKVDIKDLTIAAETFGSYVGSPRWNPVVDINQDGKVDMRDLVLIAKGFGNSDP